MRRVLGDGGTLAIAVPAADDLVEIREAVLGEGKERERMPRVVDELAEGFSLAGRRTIRHVVRMDTEAMRDALALTYRGARRSRLARIETLEPMDVTLAQDVGWWRKGAAEAPHARVAGRGRASWGRHRRLE